MAGMPKPPAKCAMTAQVEREFLSQNGVLPDDPTPICERWITVCRYYPDAARGSLCGDWTDVCKYALENITGQQLIAVYWLMCLRQGIYTALHKHRLIFYHTFLTEHANNEYWVHKLHDKMGAEGSRMVRKVGTRIRSGIQGPWTHSWIN